jgi:nucleoside-diphosphate-sugar epimerase
MSIHTTLGESTWPPVPASVEQLEELLSRPTQRVQEVCGSMTGDLILLGVGGKMGPTLARMAQRAMLAAGVDHRVVGVSRFSDPSLRGKLHAWGIETIACDLFDSRQVRELPGAPYVIAMPGFKFGVQEHPDRAWAANCYLPALIAQRYHDSRIVAFSTGNVYGLVPHASGGSVESDPPRPEGEYAMSALGRERMYEYFSKQNHTPVALLRLNYATELRYGVLVDLAQQLAAGQPVDVAMSYVNVIWQADANALTLSAFPHAAAPARVINLAGPDILATRDVCLALASRLGVVPQFVGEHHDDALLNNGHHGYTLLGTPAMPVGQMIAWTAQWIARGGTTLGKPTHFQTRSGKF